MEPLAYKMRPTKLDDIVGQDHLIAKNGPIYKMIQKKDLKSMILYGNPGVGKTTIANIITQELKMNHFLFNASTDNKQALKDIVEMAKIEPIALIIDEIHRMKKDIQDFLLPYVEKGDVKIIGLTTINPYQSVNPAIRSRTLIYKLHDLNKQAILIVLNKAVTTYYAEHTLTNDILDLLATMANNDVRSALNMLDAVMSLGDLTNLTEEEVKRIVLKAVVSIDKNTDLYYDTLSGLQKSIRGSDVDASIYYLGMLLTSEDLIPLTRRLLVIAYEDIGLANPNIGPRAKAATDAALSLGMPEARIPLATLVVDMALSPKSNTAYLAIDKALSAIESGKNGAIPLHLKNTYSFDPNQKPYQYPHDFPGAWVDQQYLPNEIKDLTFYTPKETSNYEKALKERFDLIQKARNKKHTK